MTTAVLQHTHWVIGVFPPVLWGGGGVRQKDLTHFLRGTIVATNTGRRRLVGGLFCVLRCNIIYSFY